MNTTLPRLLVARSLLIGLTLLLGAVLVGHAQAGSPIDRSEYGVYRGVESPASAMLEGPWRMNQFDTPRTSDDQARETVATVLDYWLQNQYPVPTVLSISVMGRTATARMLVNSKGVTSIALVSLRLKMNTWLVTDITSQ